MKLKALKVVSLEKDGRDRTAELIVAIFHSKGQELIKVDTVDWPAVMARMKKEAA